METITTNDLLTTDELARQTGLAVITLQHWRATGRGPRVARLGEPCAPARRRRPVLRRAARRVTRKVSQPETLRQAQRWDGHVVTYRAMGFCGTCASQAAYGHQLGFNVISHRVRHARP